MHIAPLNPTLFDAIYLPEEEGEDRVTALASELLSAAHGEIKVNASFSFDLPKVAEILKTQVVATGESSALLWGLIGLESDPTTTVDALCERIALGQEELSYSEVISLHLLEAKAPELAKRLVDAFVKAAKEQLLDLDTLGLLVAYCLQKGQSKAFDRLMIYCKRIEKSADEETGEILASTLSEYMFASMLFSGLTDAVHPLEDLESSAKARLGALIASLTKDIKLVEPTTYYVARVLQGEDIETIVQSSSNPLYQAMLYDAAAFSASLSNPQLAEELLSHSIELAGDQPRKISYEDKFCRIDCTSTPLEINRMASAFGYALQDIELGVQRTLAAIESVADSESFESVAAASLVVIALALYQEKNAQALELLDALIIKAKQFDIKDIDIIASGLTLLFPQRKEQLAEFISEEMPQLPELSLSLSQADLVQVVSELHRAGIFDIESPEILGYIATAVAALS